MTVFEIKDALRPFLEGGVSLMVATRDARLRPTATRATAFAVLSPNEVWVLLPTQTSVQTLSDLRNNGELAILCASPVDYRTIQLKGKCIDISEPTAEDLARSAKWLNDFFNSVAPYGMTRQKTRNLWIAGGVKVRMQVEAAFGQTPGPGAGRALSSQEA